MRAVLMSLVMLWSVEASAYSIELKGLTAVDYLVEKVDKETVDCGIEEQSIRDAMVLPLQSFTKLRDPDGTGMGVGRPAVYLVVGSIKVGASCFHSIRMSVFMVINMKLPHVEFDTEQKVELWSSGRIQYHALSLGGKSVLDAIEQVARKLAADWQEANP